MLVEMTVLKIEMVEIPDLPQDVIDFCRKRGAIIYLEISTDEYDEGGEFSDLRVSIIPHLEDDSPTFTDELFALEGYDCDKFDDDSALYFQSDGADGVEAFEKFIQEMKRRNPDVVNVTMNEQEAKLKQDARFENFCHLTPEQ